MCIDLYIQNKLRVSRYLLRIIMIQIYQRFVKFNDRVVYLIIVIVVL